MIYTDRFYHGSSASPPFFEGWYFKHRKDGQVLAVIPGLSLSDSGEEAFIQLIHEGGSHYVRYRREELSVDPQRQLIQVGESRFSPQGVCLKIHTQKLTASGCLHYGPVRPLARSLYAPGIMGPFSYLSFLECYHGVLSLGHTVSGSIQLNGQKLNFDGSTGYIEKDWGRSFPKSWLWFHCDGFDHHPSASAMLSIASIPFLGGSFTGLLFVLDTGSQQHRLATYLGAVCQKIRHKDGCVSILVRQGEYRLELAVRLTDCHPLKAPAMGAMSRTMEEYPTCPSRLRLLRGGQILWEDSGHHASFEQVGHPLG